VVRRLSTHPCAVDAVRRPLLGRVTRSGSGPAARTTPRHLSAGAASLRGAVRDGLLPTGHALTRSAASQRTAPALSIRPSNLLGCLLPVHRHFALLFQQLAAARPWGHRARSNSWPRGSRPGP